MIRLLLAVLLALAPAAVAQDALPLVAYRASFPGKSTTVSTKGAAITTDAFVAAILDGDHYPLTASYMGIPALEECKTLAKRPDGTVVVYQRTGGGMGVASRHYVIALKAKTLTPTLAEVEWLLVQHARNADGSFSGPYASSLNAHPDAVYTPYNHGSWRYDRTAGTIRYAVESDAGGSIPDFMVREGAVMAFPLELLRTRWGITP